jgi:hypothetical protein
MDESWACFAAYVYVLHLDPSSRAWEYLRRNPHYQRDWVRFRRRPSYRIAARWRLATLVDPRLDARAAIPVWSLGIPSCVTLVRDEGSAAPDPLTPEQRFSVWRIPGRKTVLGEGSRLQLILRSHSGAIELGLGNSVADGDRFAFQIPAAADDCALWDAHRAFRARIPAVADERAPDDQRPGRADLFHVRALQVLDGLACGASQRELAVALFGSGAVARGWQPDGALRAQVRYLIRRARALRDGQYRDLTRR